MRKLFIFILLFFAFTSAYCAASDRKDSLSVKKIKVEDKKKLKSVREKAVMIIEDTLTNEFLDTVNVKKDIKINDYTMVGFHYGAGLSQVMWNPSQKQDMIFVPVNTGITYTRYGKMFGYMPYFGFQAGLLYTKEGYQFQYDEDYDYTYKIEGAERAIMEVIELPVLAHMHVDFWKMKLLANIGCFAGYRMSIERFPGKTGSVKDEVAHSFLETDNRFDYGIKGGVGIGFVFDPIEIHIQGMYKHSLSSLFEPDYNSDIYYKFGYPSNIVVSAGIHFQITKRTGKTKAEIRKMAKDLVYESENIKNR